MSIITELINLNNEVYNLNCLNCQIANGFDDPQKYLQIIKEIIREVLTRSIQPDLPF